MEIESVKRHKASDKTLEQEFMLNLYNKVPFGLLTLEECEDLFRQRLEAFAILEKVGKIDKNISEITAAIRGIKSYVHKSNCILNRVGDKVQQKQDHYSHMLMRMYCIHHFNLWPWFKQCERSLLYYRLRDQALSLSGAKFEAILKTLEFDVERVVGSDLNELVRENLLSDKNNNDIFKVKFTDALRYVAKRAVPLKNGYAYLSRFEIMSIVCDAFEKYLEKELQYARQHFVGESKQTTQLLESMKLVYQDFHENQEEERRSARQNQEGNRNPYKIDTYMIEGHAKTHFPPCMRFLHESLKLDNHLKHMGRLLYGAYLRSAGLELQEAIEFWRKEFTKKMPSDKFERHYLYNIRHLYGKEGHRKALSSFSCDKIISENPGPTDKHGCPFKTFGESNLITLLKSYGFDSETDMEEILGHRKEPKLACTKFFEKLRSEPPTDVINNPMQFYFESRRQLIKAESVESAQTNDIPAHSEPAEDWDDL